jgi:hypothetical protein
MTSHQFEREMLCSFEAPVENSYYGDQMVEAKLAGRLTKVPYDPRAKVITAWDLGIKDLTSIWFAQKIGQEIHFIDFYQSSGKGLDHYARVLQEKGYLYGFHLLPHDIKLRELGTGRSRFETLMSLGSSRSSFPITARPTASPACARSSRSHGSTRSAASSASTRSGPTTCNYPRRALRSGICRPTPGRATPPMR